MIHLVVAEENLAIGVHVLCEYTRQFGGTLTTRLISEDDLEMTWECSVQVETVLTRTTFEGVEDITHLFPGDLLRWIWKLHISFVQPLSATTRARFQRST